MVCVLLTKDDAPGLWLFRSLQSRGRKDLKLVSAEELVYASSFHCGFRNGKAFFSVALHNGFVFSNETVSAVINRIQVLPLQHVQRFKTEDQEYVKTELTATFVFLFSILPRVVFNATTPAGLCGKSRSQLEWITLAGQAGFTTFELIYENKVLQRFPGSQSNGAQSVLYFNQKCYTTVPLYSREVEECCVSLGQLSGERLLEIWFTMQGEGPLFIRAVTQPSFHNIGNDFMDDVNSLL